jgi:hypothetical protein
MADDPREPLKAARIDLLLLALGDVLWRGPQPDLDAVFQLLYDNGAIIETIMPPPVKAVSGLPIAGGIRIRLPVAELAAAIQSQLGTRVRIVYGTVDGLHGILGSRNRFTNGTQIPGFAAMMRTLLTLEGGMAQEVQQVLR